MASPSWLDYGSFSLGFIGAAIGAWQLRNARSAREAEAEAREELHVVMIEQQLLRFSAVVSLLQETLAAGSPEARVHLSQVIPALGELKEFSGHILTPYEAEKVHRDRKALLDLYSLFLEDEIGPAAWTLGKATGVYLQETLKEIYGRLERERISQISSTEKVKR